MNWNTYNKLSPKLKEEYNYRFKDVDATTFNLTIVGNFIFVTMMFMLVSALCLLLPAMSSYIPHVKRWMALAGTVMAMAAVIIIVYAVYDVIRLSIHIFQEARWRKRNNIKGW